MRRVLASKFFILVPVIVGFYGFVLVTQSGLKGFDGSMQNDGYAVSGGIVIFLAGVISGAWLVLKHKK